MNDEHRDMVEDCERREWRLTEWESDFIENVSHGFSEGRTLTPRQAETLEEIWEKVML